MEGSLNRFLSDEFGTMGSLSIAGQVFPTLEPPWADNARDVSCIPDGEYTAVSASSSRFGSCYLVLDVPDRDFILFHAGNWAGDKTKGLRSDSSGCILIGSKFGMLAGQRAVLNSKAAFKKFLAVLGGQPLNVKINSIWLARAKRIVADSP